MKGPFTFGSLFAGIGGLDLGLERTGMECRWQIEIDPYCTKVLEKHWPEVKRYGDIREIKEGKLEEVDLICGGFPCQDISTAGRGKGITGERSGLWFEMLRIIRMVRPRYVLVENVPMLRHRGLNTVLGGLAESGYDAEWDCIPAGAFGTNHRRERLFIFAHTNRFPGGRLYTGRTAIFGPTKGDNERLWKAIQDRAPWTTEPEMERVAYGVPAQVDRLRCLGNAVVPQVAEYLGGLIMAREGGR
ncbi:MAG: DNA (cytosine-5-)-methyltransferase [Thermoplasmata archaeon]|nr:DNA (cytosine-5-)-methyltransferase [Thermoplasmata archaeon]